MKIRDKLTLMFSALTIAILLFSAGVVYFSAVENRENEFYVSLKRDAIIKANLFLNAKVVPNTLQTIYNNNRESLNEVEVAIYDTTYALLYHDAVDTDYVKETNQNIDLIKLKKEIKFYQEERQVLGLLFSAGKKNYILTATAYDQYGYNKLRHRRQSIGIVLVGSILLLYVAGRIFSKKALSQLTEMVNNIKEITASHLDLRIKNTNGKDELAELANTFNEMLDRLEKSFDAQRGFVSNISHELRTPLSAIITELELSANKVRKIEEYQIVVQNALGDARRLAKLTNSLLDFAKASYDTTEISFKDLRLDELLLDAQQQVARTNPAAHISISFADDFSDLGMDIKGNEYLLKTAFVNLIENACKFSPDRHCSINISFANSFFILKFTDKGIGIANDELAHIFTPFHRGSNKRYAEGNGIGLSLTQKIISLHKGQIEVVSQVMRGTTFTIKLPVF